MKLDINKLMWLLGLIILVSITAYSGKSLEILSPMGGLKFESAPSLVTSKPQS